LLPHVFVDIDESARDLTSQYMQHAHSQLIATNMDEHPHPPKAVCDDQRGKEVAHNPQTLTKGALSEPHFGLLHTCMCACTHAHLHTAKGSAKACPCVIQTYGTWLEHIAYSGMN